MKVKEITNQKIDKFVYIVYMRLRFGPNRLNEDIEAASYAVTNTCIEQGEIHPSQCEEFFERLCDAALQDPETYARNQTRSLVFGVWLKPVVFSLIASSMNNLEAVLSVVAP